MIDYRLFEYVFLDPVAVYEQPILFAALGLEAGYILVHNKNYPIGRQIEEADIPDYSKNKRDRAMNQFIIFKKRNPGWINEEFKDVNAHPRFIEDANNYKRIYDYEPLCVVSAENQGRTGHNEIEVDSFIKLQFKDGKKVQVPRTPKAFALSLLPLFNKSVFKDHIEFLSIIDPYIDRLGQRNPSYTEEKLIVETFNCIEKISAHLIYIFEKKILKEISGLPYLQLNFFLQNKDEFSTARFEKKFEELVRKSEFGFFRGDRKPLQLVFYVLTEIGSARVHHRWSFSKSFILFHHDGVCSLGKKKKGSKEDPKVILEIKKLLDDEDLENIFVDEQKTDHTDLKSFREMYSEKSKKFKVYKYTPKLFELISSAEPKMEAELDA